MQFDITRLQTMREKILLARDTALAKSRQFQADKEKQATSFHARRALALEEYAAVLNDAMSAIGVNNSSTRTVDIIALDSDPMDMTGYTKLFGSIVASTIWRESHEVRIVWITMLALANKSGVVEASLPGLADLARVTIPECKKALEALSAPDEYSRTSDHEGRRVEKVDGGWLVLNHGKYRAKMSVDERREYLREKQAESRARRREAGDVNGGQQTSTPSTQSEAEASPEAKAPPSLAALPRRAVTKGIAPCTREEAYAYGKEIGMPQDAVQPWYDHFQSNGWLVSGKTPMKDWQAALRNGKRTWERDKAKYGTTVLQTTGQAEPEGWQEFLKQCYPNEKRKEYRYAQSFVKNDFAAWVKKEGGK